MHSEGSVRFGFLVVDKCFACRDFQIFWHLMTSSKFLWPTKKIIVQFPWFCNYSILFYLHRKLFFTKKSILKFSKFGRDEIASIFGPKRKQNRQYFWYTYLNMHMRPIRQYQIQETILRPLHLPTYIQLQNCKIGFALSWSVF
jgi:hypothetical protein